MLAGRAAGLQVNVHVALRRDRAGLRVIGKAGAVDLVETIGVVAVDDDVDFVQDGAASVLILLRPLGVDAEESPAAFGLRKREPFRALLNVYVEFFGSMLNGMMDAPARVEIKARHHQQDDDRGEGEPATQALGVEGHG